MSSPKLAADTINVFRSSQELASSNTAQLRRTIAELEERIHAQDLLIAEQKQALIEKEGEINNLTYELNILSGAINDPRHKGEVLAKELQEGYKQHAKIQQLAKANESLIRSLEELEGAFQDIISAVIANVEAALAALAEMPATKETSNMHARAKKEIAAIMRAKKANQISPANCLRQLADVEYSIISFITARPTLTFKKAEHYRAALLVETLYRDPKAKSLNSANAIQIISTAEEKPIARMQARRAMEWAAKLQPDKVMLRKRGQGKGRAWTICKIGGMEGGKA